jgi:hypothetical protein
MGKAKPSLLKKLNLGETEALTSKPKRYDLQLNDKQTHKQHAKALCDLGREHARKWLNAPHSHPLAWLRLLYQDSVIEALDWGELNSPSVHVTADRILAMMAMYNAGIDEALQEFVLLAKAMPQEVMQ